MPERHKFVIRCLIVFGLLAVVAWAVDVRSAFASLMAADAMTVAMALLLVQAQIVLSALRWRFTAARLGQTLDLPVAIGEYYLASLLNLVLPGGVGGDAVRVLRVDGTGRDERARRSAPLRAVVLERLAGQIAFCVLALAGLTAWIIASPSVLPGGTVAVIMLPVAVLAVVATAIGLSARYGPKRLRKVLEGAGPDMRRAWFDGRAWLVQGILSLAVAALYIATFALSSAAVGAPLPFLAAVAIIPLVLLSMLLPVSVGGFGLREGAAAALWPLAGFAGADGLAAALLYGIVSIVGALPGAFWLIRRRPAQADSRA